MYIKLPTLSLTNLLLPINGGQFHLKLFKLIKLKFTPKTQKRRKRNTDISANFSQTNLKYREALMELRGTHYHTDIVNTASDVRKLQFNIYYWSVYLMLFRKRTSTLLPTIFIDFKPSVPTTKTSTK